MNTLRESYTDSDDGIDSPSGYASEGVAGRNPAVFVLGGSTPHDGTKMENCSHKKVKWLKDTRTPDFLYCVIRETEDTVTLGWQTRNWNEVKVPRSEVVEVAE